MLTLQQYCAQFDDAVRKFARRDICVTEFPFEINLAKFWQADFPPAAVAMMALVEAGWIGPK